MRPDTQSTTELSSTELTNIERAVEQAIDLLDRALTILDDQHLFVAAAKVDDARHALRWPGGAAPCLLPS